MTINNKQELKDQLDKIGPGFCLAKWTQVTMHLGPGLTHSCHHPSPHKIPLNEIKDNSGALHNTNYKKEIRKEMLAGKRPAECNYCWRIEDNTKEFSDRVNKSFEKWSIGNLEEISKLSGDENYTPKYVEVSFNNTCNFKCSYCGPTFSSKWAEEIRHQGAYSFSDSNLYNEFNINEKLYRENDNNPYIEAFWKWFPEAVKSMHTFRITGGEPLLSKHTFNVIDYLIENPQPNLEFAINTNACPTDLLWNKFIEKIKLLEEKRVIKKLFVFVSAESIGRPAEYSRDGMDWDIFANNVESLLNTSKHVFVSFMSAFNIFSLTTFEKFLKYVLDLKRKYNYVNVNNTPVNRVFLDIPYLRYPEFLDINIATDDLVNLYIKSSLDFMIDNKITSNQIGFTANEISKFKRIYEDCIHHLDKGMNEKIQQSRIKFTEFVDQYDQRRNKNFLVTFPELENFYVYCKESN